MKRYSFDVVTVFKTATLALLKKNSFADDKKFRPNLIYHIPILYKVERFGTISIGSQLSQLEAAGIYYVSLSSEQLKKSFKIIN